MGRLAVITVIGALAAIAAGVSFFAAARPERGDSTAVAPPSPAAVAPAPAAPIVAAVPPASERPKRGGRVLRLDEAIKELDLIRPARGKLADDFTVPMPGKTKFRLSEQRGKVVMINFWATWCPPCREEMPAMERLYREHKDAGFTILAISLDADTSLVSPYVAEHKFTFPVGLDPDMTLAEKYAVRALPSSFIVDRQGTMTALAIGPRHWDNDASHSLVEAMAR
jgi:peroxiredoxin